MSKSCEYSCFPPRFRMVEVKSFRAPVDFAAGSWTVWNSNLQLDFNVSVRDSFDAEFSALLRELDESDRFVQKSAESTSM